jgi:hypothetical protein
LALSRPICWREQPKHWHVCDAKWVNANNLKADSGWQEIEAKLVEPCMSSRMPKIKAGVSRGRGFAHQQIAAKLASVRNSTGRAIMGCGRLRR